MFAMTSDPADDHGIDYDALASRVQHSADALAQQDADYLADCQPDPTTEGLFEMKTFFVMDKYFTLLGMVDAPDFYAARRIALTLYRLPLGSGIVMERKLQ